ncbi:MAG: prolyl oligopeptidase family serine peptidase [Chitinophagaceae bacterium]|jgi:prolyl oligopeptidase|nr:prolyl oligopeptidase family serine peptidase [Chitinophagaceae bacterium]
MQLSNISKIAAGMMLFAAACNTQNTQQYNYPPTKEIPVVEDYFGTKITDNYRWLEDLQSDTVQAWFKAQANFTDSIIGKINGRDALFNRLKEYMKMGGDRFRGIGLAGNTYFYTKRKKGENVNKLYRRNLPTGEEELLFDPETLEKGTQIISFRTDDAGTKVAIALSKGGAEVCTIRILNCADRKLLDDKIGPVWSEFPFYFVNDAAAILCTKLNSADVANDNLLKNMKVFVHTIGSNPQTDRLIVSREKYPALHILSEQFPMVYFSNDKKYIFLELAAARGEQLIYYADASEFNKETINWKPLVNLEDEITGFETIGDKLFFLTHKNAPTYKIGVTSISNPDFNNAKIIVPESKNLIKNIYASKNYLFYELNNGINQDVYQIELENYSATKLPMPEGVNYGWALNDKKNDKLMAINYGWLSPYTTYEYDAGTKAVAKSEWFDMTGNYPDLTKDYAVKEVEIKSHDGVMVPLSIIYPKNIKPDGNTPCYMMGYGGYGISMEPYFLGYMTSLLEQGCIYAVAHVRGGGEKGDSWHKAGMKSTKPNTWKDFIACAEYLIDNKYTSNKKLFGEGGSAGGILIGRAITERPDLFAAAIVGVGMTNTLRMETMSNGDNQITELGSVKVPEDFKYLLEMDAQTKVQKGVHYPAVLVSTGINDARVAPWMPAKFAAVLQNNSASGKPVLFYVNYNNGHFTGDIDVTLKEMSDQFAFALWQVGHKGFQIEK